MTRHPILFSVIFIGLAMALIVLVFGSILTLSFHNGPLFSFGNVAVLDIEGAIYDSGDILKDMEKARKDDSVKAVVLRIDSPGGAVAPSQEIFEEVKKIRLKKKVVVSMGTVAASGGYYIASAADRIFASPGTITGSIGVIMESVGVEGLLSWPHLDSRVIKSGEYKDVGSPFRKMKPEEKVYLQSVLDNMYDQFKKAVSEGRGMDSAKVEGLAQGKIYTGEQALAAGLVDEMGTLYDAIDAAKKMAGLSVEAPVIWPREDHFPFNLFSSKSFIKNYFHGFDFPVWLYMPGHL